MVEPVVLGTALIYASAEGRLEVIRAIIGCGRFHEISAKNLGQALSWAAEYGGLNTIRALIGCGRFREIPIAFLNQALVNAVRAGELRIARDIVHKKVGILPIAAAVFALTAVLFYQ